MADTFDPLQNEDDVEEILRLAVHHDVVPGGNLRDRLTSSAEELGISPEVLAKAEQEWSLRKSAELDQATESQDRKKYMKIQFGEFLQHAGVYAAVNTFLVWIDWRDGRISWAFWPIMGWGIAIAIHAVSLVARGESEEKAFQKWRKKQRKLRG